MYYGMYLQMKKNFEEPRRCLIFIWFPLSFIVDIILEIVRKAIFKKIGI